MVTSRLWGLKPPGHWEDFYSQHHLCCFCSWFSTTKTPEAHLQVIIYTVYIYIYLSVVPFIYSNTHNVTNNILSICTSTHIHAFMYIYTLPNIISNYISLVNSICMALHCSTLSVITLHSIPSQYIHYGMLQASECMRMRIL